MLQVDRQVLEQGDDLAGLDGLPHLGVAGEGDDLGVGGVVQHAGGVGRDVAARQAARHLGVDDLAGGRIVRRGRGWRHDDRATGGRRHDDGPGGDGRRRNRHAARQRGGHGQDGENGKTHQ